MTKTTTTQSKSITSVKNVRGSSKRTPSSGSWSSKLPATDNNTNCSVLRCTNKATAGAHVTPSVQGASKEQWITRLCAKHNHHTNTEEMQLKKGTTVVRALKK
ncbi:hypothetical protein HKX48_006701 [Thoreauomyces humboldtii]|nr:hypothetical protein HKX48_006701 [Thoreauomyces humboldtii]